MPGSGIVGTIKNKKMMAPLKSFVKKMLSNQDDVSSKRLSGMGCILLFCVLVSVVILFKFEISELHYRLLLALFIGGLSLLGVAAVEKLWKP
jgi:hypothetical protein